MPPCWPGYEHYIIRELDGVRVCQICGEVVTVTRRIAVPGQSGTGD